MSAQRIADALAWLNDHVNYETTGPQSGGGSLVHDPEKRLRNMRTFMELMGNPQETYPSLHLTGTNGKTSTARMLTALLITNGLTAGTYTSPHVERLNERMLLNGEAITDDELADVLNTVRLYETMLDEGDPSYFEIMTAGALRYFSDAAVSAAVVEVGVGGTWDATNVIDASVAVITNIGIDHVGYLGNTRESIATHKAGIIKPSSVLVTGETDPALLSIFAERNPVRSVIIDRDFGVEGNGLAVGGRVTDLRTPRARYSDVFLGVHGRYQATNAAVALTAAEEFFEAPLDDGVVREAFEMLRIPGRVEVVHRQPLVVLDGAHNVAGATELAATVDEEFGSTTGRILVVGMLEGHEPSEILPALEAKRSRLVIACTAPSPRAVPASEIAAAAKDLGLPCVVVEDVKDAVKEGLSAAAEDEMVLVTGSLYVVGAARTALIGAS